MTFIVAEMSANHLGSFERAVYIVRTAAKAGADAIKLQCWTPGTMCVSDYRIESGPWAGRLLKDLYRECYTPWEWFKPLKDEAESLGLELFASAFDKGAVDFLEDLGVKRHKVASCELVDLPLIRYMASKGKPMILSTGMADEMDIWRACYATVNDVTLLHCISGYPASPSEFNLSGALNYLSDRFGCHQVGLSDHTMGSAVAVAATALGATMIAKHLTIFRSDGGPDAAFSMQPSEFARMVADVRVAEQACMDVEFGPQPSEVPQLALRRSLWWRRDMPAGELITEMDYMTARPATGMSPSIDIRGRILSRPVRANEPVLPEDFNG